MGEVEKADEVEKVDKVTVMVKICSRLSQRSIQSMFPKHPVYQHPSKCALTSQPRSAPLAQCRSASQSNMWSPPESAELFLRRNARPSPPRHVSQPPGPSVCKNPGRSASQFQKLLAKEQQSLSMLKLNLLALLDQLYQLAPFDLFIHNNKLFKFKK